MDLKTMLNAAPTGLDTRQERVEEIQGSSETIALPKAAVNPAKANEHDDSESTHRRPPQNEAARESKRAGTSLESTSKRHAIEPARKSDVEKQLPGTQAVYRPVLEPSYTSRLVLDDLTRNIANFLKFYLAIDPNWSGKSGIEIEAKFGTLMLKDSGVQERFEIPHIISAAILEQAEARDVPFMFRSELSPQQYAFFNEHLNREVERSNAKPRARHGIAYVHTRETDTVYEKGGARTQGSRGLRITRNDKTGQVSACIIKHQVAQLNITCPNSAFDLRISINHEEAKDVPEAIESSSSGYTASSIRQKDRLSYTHQHIRMDLTMITSPQRGKIHELEVECHNMPDWSRQALRAEAGEPSRFDDMVNQFVSTIVGLSQAYNDHS
ncbi:mRNA-capping enzyme subunit beta [Savitreella phatthalungensis]